MRSFLNGKIDFNKIEHGVLKNLYKLRLLTMEQMVFLLYPELITESFPLNPREDPAWRKSYHTKYSRVRNEVVRLKSFGYLRTQDYRVLNGRAPLTFYTLKSEKFNLVKELLDIEPLHFGTGWNDDFGDLSMDFYEFPKRIEHHLDAVNFYIQMLYVSTTFPFVNEIDYTDNVFAARSYILSNGEKMKLRPDGEIKIHGFRQERRNPNPGFHAWIEIDRGTEYGNELTRKFENYRGYLSYATTEKTITAPLILVYTNAGIGITRRWFTLLNAYQKGLMNFSPKVNLFVCNAANIFETIVSFSERNEMLLKLKQWIEVAAKANMGFLGTVHMGTGKREEDDPYTVQQEEASLTLGWYPHFVIVENNPSRIQLYLFLKFDGFETQGFCRALDFIRKWGQLPAEIRQAKEVIPVFFFKRGAPAGIPKEFQYGSEEEKALLLNSLWFNTEQETWYDENMNPIESQSMMNPLTYGLYRKVQI